MAGAGTGMAIFTIPEGDCSGLVNLSWEGGLLEMYSSLSISASPSRAESPASRVVLHYVMVDNRAPDNSLR